MGTIVSLTPNALWRNFHLLTQIPRPSGHTEAVTKFLIDFGQNLGLETKQDKIGNVVIKKNAMPGMENRPTVILQGHVDMVPQKNSHVIHDFLKDPIQTTIDGEWVTAKETTLGADDGIGVASIMAILESKELKHGPIEALFTVDEETGMYGAFDLDASMISGTILLNVDTEEEGELCMGCAGGVNVKAALQYKGEPVPEGDVAYKISLCGLKGGHSGIDIPLGRANANKLMFRLLKQLVAELDICVASVQGGTLHNAIPREAFAIITIQPENVDALNDLLADYEDMIMTEYDGIEDSISLTAKECDVPSEIVPSEIRDSVIHAIMACQNGVARMVPEMPDKVETSSNMSVLSLDADKFSALFLVRSSSDSCKDYLASSIESVFALIGAKVTQEGCYSGWSPNVHSPILKAMKENYKTLFGKEAIVCSVHAGLECGIIGALKPELDMISFGPTIVHPHSPDEKVNIQSVQKYWDLITLTLAKI